LLAVIADVEGRKKKEEGKRKKALVIYERRKKQSSATVSAIKNVLNVGCGCYNCWGLTEECEISRTLAGG